MMDEMPVRMWALLLIFTFKEVRSQDIIGCGGFVQSSVKISFERVQVKLFTKQGAIKFSTECAPNNGYFLVAVYDKGDYILKIDPPSGWSFAPSEIELVVDGVSDRCSKGEDINFKFTGFSIFGSVGALGRSLGPAGVALVLRNIDGSELGHSTTEDGGKFSFPNVMPGKYYLKGSHTSWSILNDVVEIMVNADNAHSNFDIVVAGFDVKGRVLSGGERIQGVSFVLLSSTVSQVDVVRCEPIPEIVLNMLPDQIIEKPLCCAVSSHDGEFIFPVVPSGDYVLIPVYVTDNMAFDVVPSKIAFTVNYRSVVLQTPFQVYGFSVGGKIVDSLGLGISGVQISASNEKNELRIATSQWDGTYLLENVTTGIYIFKLQSQHVFFNEERLHISPNNPTLRDIVSSKYSVCGSLEIVSLPTGAFGAGQRKVLLQPMSSSNVEMRTRNADALGKFCFEVSPGKYKIEPVVLPHERKLGLVLKPTHLEIDVANQPILNLIFTQFVALVSGKLACQDSCQDVAVYMTSSDRDGAEKVSSRVNKNDEFIFTNVLPGKYKVTPVKKKWCWSPRNLDIEISDSNVNDLLFMHDGFFLKCIISHDITLNFKLDSQDLVVGSFNLSKGTNRFCLKAAGVYELTPKSCFKFEKETYIFDTSNPVSLTLSVASYQLLVLVKSEISIGDLYFVVKHLSSKKEEIISAQEVSPENVEFVGQMRNILLAEINLSSSQQISVIKFYAATFWGKLAEEFLVTPMSKEVLFYPEASSVTLEGKCPGGVVDFRAQKGKFIEGIIVPAFSNVIVTINTISSARHEARKITVLTDHLGRYRIGPFHSEIEYEVTAFKDGYYIVPKEGEKENFFAIQLGAINVNVLDELDNPMTGVLLSVSGGQYRNNNLTAEDGSYVFSALRPGGYFLRPMQKEYSFEPSSKLIDIKEGETVALVVKGKRVAFSCFGSTLSLAGLPEENVIVEAIGLDMCSQYHEESTSDERGFYRMRGLQPGCSYAVQMMKTESNNVFGRTAPVQRIIKVEHEDISQINFIVFTKQSALQLTAYIDTSMDLLQTLKVFLFDEDNLDSPIHTIVPDVLRFIQFPPLKLKSYVVKLETTMSAKTHIIKSTSATVANDGGMKKHVVLKFDAKEKKLGIEPTQSVIALPLAVALLFICYNYDAAWLFAVRISAFLRSFSRPEERSYESSDEDHENSSKLSKKKKR